MPVPLAMLRKALRNCTAAGAWLLRTGPLVQVFAATAIIMFVLLVLPPAAHATEPFERGMEAFHVSKYQEALGQFRLAAGSGNTRAQEILGFMYLHGPGLYGAAVPLDRAQSIYWFGRAAKGGREVAQHMLCVLTGHPATTVVDRTTCVAAAVLAAPGLRP